MILSDSKIKKRPELLNPLIEENIGPSSVDLCLYPQLKYIKGSLDGSIVIDTKVKQEYETIDITENGVILKPKTLYLGTCVEQLNIPNDIVAEAEGKSSLARLGLFIHITAGFIDPGFCGSLVLEFMTIHPIILYPNMPICQIKFHHIEGVETDYSKKSKSKYNGQSGIQESLYYKNFQR